MAFHVEVLNESGHPAPLTPERATELCRRTFLECGLDPERAGELSVALVKPEVMQHLNLKFRGKDAPTDVLSFEVDGPYGEMVGEVVICPECAEMSVEELVVHGALHLAGMDHGEDFEASEMARVQVRVMEAMRRGR
ncbi:Endoribonuclease YbeY [Rubrobacter xylanophilus DSM 9941]|uniref:rRNA maturation RNase YbeY n=1 Tax=Rubrobacter xylanophilus TaxID=49319 RepID=UPI001C64383A|nr:rRNA maturation RNase YbeY [Rubrobacter xylanophilus]QYJ14744.1 Endoribonuclease YbeY [Rubrobacter xylanophilus DSM 9941]